MNPFDFLTEFDDWFEFAKRKCYGQTHPIENGLAFARRQYAPAKWQPQLARFYWKLKEAISDFCFIDFEPFERHLTIVVSRSLQGRAVANQLCIGIKLILRRPRTEARRSAESLEMQWRRFIQSQYTGEAQPIQLIIDTVAHLRRQANPSSEYYAYPDQVPGYKLIMEFLESPETMSHEQLAKAADIVLDFKYRRIDR